MLEEISGTYWYGLEKLHRNVALYGGDPYLPSNISGPACLLKLIHLPIVVSAIGLLQDVLEYRDHLEYRVLTRERTSLQPPLQRRGTCRTWWVKKRLISWCTPSPTRCSENRYNYLPLSTISQSSLVNLASFMREDLIFSARCGGQEDVRVILTGFLPNSGSHFHSPSFEHGMMGLIYFTADS